MRSLSKKAFQRLAVFYSDEEIQDTALELLSYASTNVYITKNKDRIEGKLQNALDQKTYTHDFGIKEYKYYLDLAAKHYVMQFGESRRWYEVFPKNVRAVAAEMLANQWEAETGAMASYA